jgi:hypothetical protein
LASDLTDADVAEDGPGAELGGHAAEHLAVPTAGICLLGAAQRGKVGGGVRGGRVPATARYSTSVR